VSASFKSGDVARADAALRAATNGHLGVKPAAVPDDVAKDAEISDSVLLKAYTTASNGEVLSHSWRPIYLRYARIGIAAILAADTEGRKDE